MENLRENDIDSATSFIRAGGGRPPDNLQQEGAIPETSEKEKETARTIQEQGIHEAIEILPSQGVEKIAKDTTGIGSLYLRDLQPRVREGPKPTDAPEATQGSLEVAEERDSVGEKKGVRLPSPKRPQRAPKRPPYRSAVPYHRGTSPVRTPAVPVPSPCQGRFWYFKRPSSAVPVQHR
ncbi:hypothetical protein F3Y22_tig00110387pilonHSYRG00166 [Hibiscus syriacus]|uniref:Uncharacterized protein n=1 Tax=Hibiscus syriacus TaxID=106335 RepID=A0A6A3ASZ9_HIBSY|nr:hypothetical protein F3Y22_tig00110387pilonHSYRG00166 [Hibiscus syriacus]